MQHQVGDSQTGMGQAIPSTGNSAKKPPRQLNNRDEKGGNQNTHQESISSGISRILDDSNQGTALEGSV